MKKSAIKIASVSLATILAIGGTGLTIHAYNSSTANENVSTMEQLISNTYSARNVQNIGTDNLYVITNADGSINKILDNNNLAISDCPVNIRITYMLNGAPIAPADLAGKSGKVTIRFDYENVCYDNVIINGIEEKIYTPYAMISGLILNDENFSNIEIVNGRLIDDGNRTIAIGLALPGLSENLALSDDSELYIPDYLEITADVTDFSLDMTMSIATNDLFSSDEFDNLTSAEDIKDALDTVGEAVDSILSGSNALYEGLETLNEKVGELSEGVSTLNTGAESLMNGASQVSAGAGQVSTGAAQLSSGLSTLVSNNAALNSGATDVFNTFLSTATAQLQAAGFNYTLTIDNYNQVLDGIITSLDSDAVYSQALSTVTAGVDANYDQIVAGVTAQVNAMVTANITQQYADSISSTVRATVLESMGITEDDFAGLDADTQASINNTIATTSNEKLNSSETAAMISASVDSYMSSEEGIALLNNSIASYRQQLIDENMNSSEVQSALSQASNGLASIVNLKTSLNSYNQFYVGLQAYTAGVAKASQGAATLASGAGTLATGSTTLYNGTVELYNGTTTLNNSMPTLCEGIEALRDGSKELSDGLTQFKDELTEKAGNLNAEELENLIARLEATAEVARNHKVVNAAGDVVSVKYIYRSTSIN